MPCAALLTRTFCCRIRDQVRAYWLFQSPQPWLAPCRTTSSPWLELATIPPSFFSCAMSFPWLVDAVTPPNLTATALTSPTCELARVSSVATWAFSRPGVPSASPNPKVALTASPEHRGTVASLAERCRGRRRMAHRRAAPPCHLGRRRATSIAPLSQPCVPITTGRRGEAVGGDLTAGDLAEDELGPVSAALCFGVTDGWAPLTAGPRCQCVHTFIFLFIS